MIMQSFLFLSLLTIHASFSLSFNFQTEILNPTKQGGKCDEVVQPSAAQSERSDFYRAAEKIKE